MSKYCAKCGKVMNDEAMFCPACGTKVTNGATISSKTDSKQKNLRNTGMKNRKKESGKKIGIVIAAVILLSVVIWGIGNLMTPGYEKPIRRIENGINNTKILDLPAVLSPDDADTIESLLSYNSEIADKTLMECMEDVFGYEDAKVKMEIVDKVKIDKEAYEYYLDENDATKAKEVYSLSVKVIVSYKENGESDEETETVDAVVEKIGGKWKLADMPLIQYFE